MAGHIGGLGYSVRVDGNGRPLVGWTLTVYDGGTSTPSSVYQDYALSIAHTNPIVADSIGMCPMFWVADGTYRVRGLDADGNELFDDDGVVALGPSSGTGGGGTSVDSNALFQTGDMLWVPISGTRTGWVRANARTIGSAASGATERAASDAEDLFLYLWSNFSDSLCPVTGGRGGSAAADWAANKVIATLDMRSKSPFGLDDMGNTALAITGGSTSAAAAVGASTYTIAQGNLPNVSLSSSALTAASTHSLSVGTDITNGLLVARNFATDSVQSGGDGGYVKNATAATISLASGTVSGTVSSSVAGTVPLGGSGTDLDILTPARVGTWFVRL
jgi:hypothetical protein